MTATRKSCSIAQALAGFCRERARQLEKPAQSRGRASAAKNAMLRFVARVLIARQHDLCGTRCWAATMTLAHPTGNRTCGEFGFKLSLWCFTFLNYTKSTKYEALEKNAVSRQQIA